MNASEIIARAKAKKDGRITDEPKAAPVTVSADIPQGMEGLKPLADMLKPFLNLNISEAKLRALVDDAVSRFTPRPTELVIATPEGEKRDLGKVHKLVPTLIRTLRRQAFQPRGVLLVGPAGSAKTSACEKAAEALGLNFYPISVGPQTSKTDLTGFVDANGKPVITSLRKAYSEGGLLLLDEIDAANAGVLTTINALFSNGQFTWADHVTTKRHPDFRFVAVANTYGTGANALYVGRNQLDAASMDRFTTLYWDYDEEFEKALVLDAAARVNPDSQAVALKWFQRVVELRKAAERSHTKVVISPRASIAGAVALADGEAWADVEAAEISGRMPAGDWQKILEHV